jgi:hypothetical protein
VVVVPFPFTDLQSSKQGLEAQADEFGFLADAGETGGSRKRFLIDVQVHPPVGHRARKPQLSSPITNG